MGINLLTKMSNCRVRDREVQGRDSHDFFPRIIDSSGRERHDGREGAIYSSPGSRIKLQLLIQQNGKRFSAAHMRCGNYKRCAPIDGGSRRLSSGTEELLQFSVDIIACERERLGCL